MRGAEAATAHGPCALADSDSFIKRVTTFRQERVATGHGGESAAEEGKEKRAARRGEAAAGRGEAISRLKPALPCTARPRHHVSDLRIFFPGVHGCKRSAHFDPEPLPPFRQTMARLCFYSR
uniref:Uncharacterized protein n=1 Tax=Oryza meridionalis TaxID=40149 RepID=A0A0E0CBA6_9ORYZ